VPARPQQRCSWRLMPDTSCLMTGATRTYPRYDHLPILLVYSPERGRRLLARLRDTRPLFVCTVAHTETAEIDGISGAGATAALRRLTAAADVEALFHGRPLCMDGVPSNPGGAPGPVIITLAGLRMAGLDVVAFDAGLRVQPDAPITRVADRWGDSIATGRAVPHAADLFARGLDHGARLAGLSGALVLAESVPGGTTTALSLLCGLGYDAWDKVSSSMPGNAHAQKSAVVRSALAAAGLDDAARQFSGLGVAAAVGDPMQPFVAGLALAALPRVPVLLAGGSQMAAVLALMVRLATEHGLPFDPEAIGIATTRWVANDPTADLAGLVAQVADVPVFASDLDFGRSQYRSLRRYEDFLVKEGVGAGAAAITAALLTAAGQDTLLTAIEAVYREIYGAAVE